MAQLSFEKNDIKEDSPSIISIRQSLSRNIESYIPGIKALLPFSIEVIELIVSYVGVGQARSFGRAPDGTDDDYELFEWEFRTKAIGEMEFSTPGTGSPTLSLDLSESGDPRRSGHIRSHSQQLPASSNSLPSVSENSDEPPVRFEPGSIVFHVDGYGHRATRSLATSSGAGRPTSLSDSGRVTTSGSENSLSPASQKSPGRLSGLFGGSRDRSGGGSRRGSLTNSSSSSSSSSSTS